MTRRTAQARYISRDEAGCIEFDAALDAYLEGADAEHLLRAASKVVGSAIKLHWRAAKSSE